MFKKAAVFSDIHLGLKNNSRTHNQDCVEFTDWFIEKAHEHSCETGIFCGDFHHNRNSVNVTTMQYSLYILEKLGANFDQFFYFPGNHDLYYKDKRDVHSVEFGKHIPGITVVNDIWEEDDVALVPWLVGNEWEKMKNLKAKYVFGHFELPNFYMNAQVKMPDTGELKREHFQNQDYVFTGHFHKRQIQKNIHYIGNAFPHNYADAWDDDRGMMILDRENRREPEYINWLNGPKYRTLNLSEFLDPEREIIKNKMYLRITVDVPITYEEANYIKETYIDYNTVRELSLIPQKQVDEHESQVEIQEFDSVDEIVSNEITAIDSENYNPKFLLDIYNEL